ncbi:MAG: hypothetical protein AB7M12_09825 [Hyphomonadaceae bacterium]
MRRRAAQALAGALAILVAAEPFALAAEPAWLGGWTGQETQIGGGDKSYPVRVTLTGDGGTTEYPTLKCGGVLRRVGSQGAYMFFTETITYGPCVDGVVTAAPAGARLAWNWTGVIDGEAIYAYATLDRWAGS